jgi:Predicted metal-dependent hydrolase of the TIM-barrel fold
MKIIDFHTHIFPDTLAQRAIDALKQHSPESMAFTDGTLAGLKKSMQQSGVTRSVLLPIATKPAQVRTINETCKALMSEDCVPFGTLHPESKDFEDEIALLLSFHVKGIKFHPEYQDFYIDNPRLFPIYDALQASNMIVVFHAGKDPGPFTCDHALPPAIAAVHRNFPRLTMVAAHMGGWKVWDDVEKHILASSIYFDTAAVREFMAPEEFIRLARKHGLHRVLFGTDSPWFDQAEDIRWIDSLKLTQEEKDRILFKNAEMLLEGHS